MKNFKKLKIWQKGMKIVNEVYRIANLLPEKEKYGLYPQITKAAVSIGAFITRVCPG